ncbi:potassium transporter Trk [Labedella populi]|uniref:Potassium transporter Trk n=1 Tax=Labedella populi TaxID=2498850 RepID=A0A3S4ECT4_9MICO|nr:potassium transporter Trk [Labedella populi]RWZ68381.1 potassium transporter Trk [Labedella populi]
MSLEQPSPVDPHDAEPTRERVIVRRAPKVWGFLALGTLLGVAAALILTFAFRPADGGPTVTEDGTAFGLTQVFGFLLVCLVPIGAGVGALAAIVLDRILARKAVEVDVDRIDVAADPGFSGGADATDDMPSDATPNEDFPRR